MIFMVEDKMPHAHIFFHSGIPIPEKLDKENIADAYRDLISTYRGVIDYVKIIDGIGDGVYSPQEIIAAGIFITDGLDGVLIKDRDFPSKSLIKLISSEYEIEEAWIANGSTDSFGHKVKGLSYERSKYIRINGLDMVLLMNDYRVLSGEELSGCRFDGDNGKLYKLRTKRVENNEFYAESSHANDRSPEDE